MYQKIKTALKKIQTLDHPAKKRWVVGASAITIILIIVLWLSYIDLLIKPIETSPMGDSGGEFWPVFKNGLAVVFDSIQNTGKNLMAKIMSERSITIEK